MEPLDDLFFEDLSKFWSFIQENIIEINPLSAHVYEPSLCPQMPVAPNGARPLADTVLAEMLTHWGRDKMAAIFQTTFSNGFFEWKCMNFDYHFTGVCS